MSRTQCKFPPADRLQSGQRLSGGGRESRTEAVQGVADGQTRPGRPREWMDWRGYHRSWWLDVGTRGREAILVAVGQPAFLADRGATEIKPNDRKHARGMVRIKGPCVLELILSQACG